VLLAGPFMTANEALAAVRGRQIGWPAFAGVLAFCLFWIAATGVFFVGLVENARDPIG
jgi:threonine/homoserine/homoserine lactone efflux protein